MARSDIDYAPEGKWTGRDKKRRKKRYGMLVDGAGLRLLAKLVPKKKPR